MSPLQVQVPSSAHCRKFAPPYWQSVPALMQLPGRLAPNESQHSLDPHSALSTQPNPASNPGPASDPELLHRPPWHVCAPRQLTQAAPAEPWPHCALL